MPFQTYEANFQSRNIYFVNFNLHFENCYRGFEMVGDESDVVNLERFDSCPAAWGQTNDVEVTRWHKVFLSPQTSNPVAARSLSSAGQPGEPSARMLIRKKQGRQSPHQAGNR